MYTLVQAQAYLDAYTSMNGYRYTQMLHIYAIPNIYVYIYII